MNDWRFKLHLMKVARIKIRMFRLFRRWCIFCKLAHHQASKEWMNQSSAKSKRMTRRRKTKGGKRVSSFEWKPLRGLCAQGFRYFESWDTFIFLLIKQPTQSTNKSLLYLQILWTHPEAWKVSSGKKKRKLNTGSRNVTGWLKSKRYNLRNSPA